VSGTWVCAWHLDMRLAFRRASGILSLIPKCIYLEMQGYIKVTDRDLGARRRPR